MEWEKFVKIAILGTLSKDLIKYPQVLYDISSIDFDKNTNYIEVDLQIEQSNIASWFLDNTGIVDYFIYTDFVPEELLNIDYDWYLNEYENIIKLFNFYAKSNNIKFIQLCKSLGHFKFVEKLISEEKIKHQNKQIIKAIEPVVGVFYTYLMSDDKYWFNFDE